jgi:serine/threonine-protein kinase
MDRIYFLHHLERSRLLSEEQCRQVSVRFPESSGESLARALMAEGLLTAYQADQLLLGLSKGFFLGPYRILEFLGQGGMAYIFKAVHTTMERVVALKVFRRDLYDSDQARALAQWESRVLAQLNHPNIVTIYDANQAKGVHFLALEYVAGPSLYDLARHQGPLPIGLVCELIRQAALALQHAHERGVVHRDIKPSNLLIGAQSPNPVNGPTPLPEADAALVLKLFDFGLARPGNVKRYAAEEATALALAAGGVCGTPDFISPEQGTDFRAVDIRSDLYSLGCTFYFALTGKFPYAGRTALEKLVQHMVAQPKPLEERRGDIPSAVAYLVRRLMSKNPAERFENPGELVASLSPWCKADGQRTTLGDSVLPSQAKTMSSVDLETSTA